MKICCIRIAAISRLAWVLGWSIVFGFIGGLGTQSAFAIPFGV